MRYKIRLDTTSDAVDFKQKSPPLYRRYVSDQHIGDIAAAPDWWKPSDQGLLTVLLDLEATPSIKRMNFP